MENKSYESRIGNFIRFAGATQVIVYTLLGGLYYDGIGLLVGLFVGIVSCFFFYGFAVIVDAANKYLKEPTHTDNN